MPLPEIVYGAWVTEVDGKRVILARMSELDFLMQFKLAFLESKDADTAMKKVREMLVSKVREAVA